MKRCGWVTDDPLYMDYHDHEWGQPVHDDRTHFEFLVLESAQAGLSWITILRKRENYREAYDNFQPEIVATYDTSKLDSLLNNAGIVRNRRKIEASINNAKCFLEVQKEFGTFDRYIWAFVKNQSLIGHWKDLSEVPASTELSDQISKDMKRRGFRFIGTTIIYSYLQAVGIIIDHTIDCFCYQNANK
ncbi:DNA-3-methyladenine glycosylase I [Vallitalea okinawensis]|uniref:DNA-3-methyladenine glycosylase I n=1 Tax=Vallitalea okinawensis TaxID=2078660 RepID=UPI000CFD3C06|nr:DNA-3-methyladenine glycosylase I [Vallitalea okinawensis]